MGLLSFTILTQTVSETLILKHSGFDKKSNVGGGGEGRHEKLAEEKWAWPESQCKTSRGEINTFGIAYIGVLNPEEVQSRYDKNIFDKGRKRGKTIQELEWNNSGDLADGAGRKSNAVWNSAHCRIFGM